MIKTSERMMFAPNDVGIYASSFYDKVRTHT